MILRWSYHGFQQTIWRPYSIQARQQLADATSQAERSGRERDSNLTKLLQTMQTIEQDRAQYLRWMMHTYVGHRRYV